MTKNKVDIKTTRKIVLSVTVDPDVLELAKKRAVSDNNSLSFAVEKLLKAYGNANKKK